MLHELETSEGLKTQEFANRENLTATEAVRHLQRLSEASLIQRKPEGSYAITEYGRIVLQISKSLEFVHKYREYFTTHDIRQIPNQFIIRIGELSETRLSTNTVDSLDVGQRMFIEAEEYGWGIVEGHAPELMVPIMGERIRKGVEMKFLIPEGLLPTNAPPQKNIEARGLTHIPAVIGVTEKEAAVCFRFKGGRVDYAGFFGKDREFRNWAKDLFLYYWEKGKKYPTPKE